MNYSDEIFVSFLEEAQEHLSSIEEKILAMESQGEAADIDLVNTVFRAIHTIKGSAGFFNIEPVKNLSHALENILGGIRSREMACTPECAQLLLEGADLLKKMLSEVESIESFDPRSIIEKLVNMVPGPKKETLKNVSKTDQPGSTGMDLKSNSGEVIIPFDNKQMQLLQQGEKGGRYIYGLCWILDPSEDLSAGSVAATIAELAQYSAIGPAVVRCIKEGDVFDRSAEVYLIVSTVVEPALFLDIVNDKRVQCSILTDQKEKENNSLPQVLPEKPEEISGKYVTDSMPAKANKNEKGTEISHAGGNRPESSIRVNIGLLDRLMVMAGELVLARNALLRQVGELGNAKIQLVSQQVDSITSGMQEAILATRMQSVGIVFNKFKRIVHDLGRNLGKTIKLTITGDNVELDKTIIEALNDPLTHLVRNSIDHGIESSEARRAAGKDTTGNLALSARHEAGHVILEVADDGAGIDPQRIREKAIERNMLSREEAARLSDRDMVRFVFKPGFSTAEKVTQVSGRGVGMDVVLSNFTAVGGSVDIDSSVGRGTKIIIKLPLTLAIMPSILVCVAGERFAVPQINVTELVRIPASDVGKRIERIGDATVIRLRKSLVPLVRLADVLEIGQTFTDANTKQKRPERRRRIEDRRLSGSGFTSGNETHKRISEQRSGRDRRKSAASAINVLIVSAGALRFGLVVDSFLDSEEIVVKPLGLNLKKCREYAGATIVGDGSVALILNIAGIGASAELAQVQDTIDVAQAKRENGKFEGCDASTYLIVRDFGNNQFAIPLGVVSRIEKVRRVLVTSIGKQAALPYGDSSMALLDLDDVIGIQHDQAEKDLLIVVFRAYSREVGIIVSQIMDIIEITAPIDTATYLRSWVLGSVVIQNTISLILDLHAFVDAKFPEYRNVSKKLQSGEKTVLIVEDSPFFLRQFKSILTDAECSVITATNGAEGLHLLQDNADKVKLLFTDIEMPVMDGVEMVRRIRAEARFKHLPIIAVTSLSGEGAERRAKEAGVNEYLIKMDREQIIERCRAYLHPVPA